MIKQSVVRDESQVFDLRLRDKHAIKAILMIAWQPPSSLRMKQGDWGPVDRPSQTAEKAILLAGRERKL